MAPLARFPALAAFLAGGSAKWPDLNITADELMSLCEAEDLSALVYQRLTESDHAAGWPPALREGLSVIARRLGGEELLRGAETRVVIDALARAGIRPILIKGTPLAYGRYDTPASRPRDDTDLLIPAPHVEAARVVMESLGYAATVYCSDLFSQFEVQKTDRFGVLHVFDVHWKISTQPVFADVLVYDEILPRSVPVPALGAAAIAPGPLDALVLACVHPVMHHRDLERVLWSYDIHLLVSALTPEDFEAFARLAREKKVAAVCAHQLRRAQAMFGTSLPAQVLSLLEAARDAEPSAEYLAPARRWHDELIASVRGLSSFRERARLLREVLFPGPRYMLGAYGLSGKPLGRLLLPVLYLHRHVHGAWKVLARKK